MKVDPYLNFDAGTMNPIAHGEVFVTDDGGECDMDIGNYERFLNKDLSKEDNITTGQVYNAVIEDERKGKYLGKCVQIIPHVTDEIKRRIRERTVEERRERRGHRVRRDGGGHREPAVPRGVQADEARGRGREHPLRPRHARSRDGRRRRDEDQADAAQRPGAQAHRHPARPHRSQGDKALPTDAKEKLALFTSVPVDSVISNPDVDSIYQVPEALYREGRPEAADGPLDQGQEDRPRRIGTRSPRGSSRQKDTVTVAMVGKYVTLMDSYVSVNLALKHAAAANGVGRGDQMDRVRGL